MAIRKKPPTRKQLAARRKFVKMVRARARAARAAKRNAAPKRRVVTTTKRWANPRRGKLAGLSVRKGGRKLFGAAAAAVLRKRGKKNPRFGPKGEKVYQAIKKAGAYGKRTASVAAATARKMFGKNPKRRGTLLTSRTKNGIFRTAARQAISRRLHAPIRFRRRRNPNGTPEDIAAMHEMFLGRPTESTFEITAPAGTPKDVAVLGSLVCLKTEEEDFEFDKGEAYLGADGRANLYVLGDTTPVETNTNFGEIEEIRYEARKDHLNPFRWRRRKARRNSSNVEYFHFFGEEDGVMPKLKSDGDGLLHISGGNYTVEAEGIIN